MPLLYDECLIDLEGAGVLALTLDAGAGHYPPLPADRFGYASWLAEESGEGIDRFGICTRRIDVSQLRASVESFRSWYANAVPSVRGHVEWTLQHLSDEYLESPAAAVPLGGGLALLLFGGIVGAPEIRIIDVPGNKVLLSIPAATLRQQLQIEMQSYGMPSYGERAPLIQASGRKHTNLWFGSQSAILRWDGGTLVRAGIACSPELGDTAFSANHLYFREREDQAIHVATLNAESDLCRIAFKRGKSGYAALCGSLSADRCAIGHEGGTVEVVDPLGSEIAAFRPIPELGRKDQLDLRMSAQGRFLLARYWVHDTIVSIERGLVASAPTPSALVEFDRERFSEEVRYRPASLLTDDSILSLERAHVRRIPLESLQWSDAIRPIAKSGKSSRRAAAFKAMMPGWIKTAVSLKPSRSARNGKSRLYGVPDLPAGISWPEYEGHKMLLLCQVDCARVHALLGDPYPGDGGLMFFVAVDQDKEPLLDDFFNPVATRVLWVPQLVAAAQPDPVGPSAAPMPISLQPDRSELPQANAAIVLKELLSEQDREEYRSYIEKRQPDGPTSGHRIGGYPCDIQGNALEAQAEATLNGDEPGHDVEGWSQAAKWRLLLQLDSDEVFMWGTDMGMLYFMIHDDDLSSGNFSRVVALTEGH